MQKKLLFGFFLLSALFCLLISSPLAADEADKNEDKQSIIVEVEGDPFEDKKYIETHHPFIEVVQVYDTLFTGLALKGDPEQLADLEAQDFIEKTHPVRTYKANVNKSVPTVNVETSSLFKDSKYTGEGVDVGIIDTGIDYTHPDLQKSYKGGYDLVDLDDDPLETQPEQGKVTLHGTHVAGIIAANGKMKGVAPEADIYSYRALGPGGMGTSVQVVAAIEKAVKDGMDILNLSLGSSVNGPDWPTSIAVNRAVELGVSVVTANGNAGPAEWTVGSPATSAKALSVGASTPLLTVPYLHDSFHDKNIPLTPLMGSVPWDLTKAYPIVTGGSESKKEMRGKIALIKRGKVPFSELAKQAEKQGAEAVLIYNNEKGEFRGAIESKNAGDAVSIPVASLTKNDGEWLLENVVSENAWIDTIYHEEKDKMAAFSSRGPVTVNWDIKPEIVAPGAAIMSTVPGGYMELQGTSMAAPHVAGGLALLKEAHPDWSPEQLKGALLTTALPIHNKKGELYEPIEQGMGRMQPTKAITTPTIIHHPLLTFGKFMKMQGTETVSIQLENVTDQEQEFTFELPDQIQGIRWFLPKSFTLEPHEKKTIPIKLSIDSNRLKKGIHQGWLILNQGDKSYKLPYLFLLKGGDYPKAMGLEFSLKTLSDEEFEYRIYLPEGAEKVSVDLYNPDTLAYERTLFQLKEQESGVAEGTIREDNAGESGNYIAVVTVKTDEEHQYSYQSKINISRE